MKERETDREEMAAQTILFQKNIEQVKLDISIANQFLICVWTKLTTPSVSFDQLYEDGESIGRWAAYIKERLHVAELRRDFQGWSGNHERHCILHDVFTM